MRRAFKINASIAIDDEARGRLRERAGVLGLLANRGEGLWVVGDTRQAIYRWRGAAPAQVQHFLKDFPHGRTKALTVNYRSLPPIVRLISAVASQMSVLPTTDSRTETAAIPERADFSTSRKDLRAIPDLVRKLR